MSASADYTTVMRTPCASTWSEATAAPVSPVTPGTAQSVKVSINVVALLLMSSIQPTWAGRETPKVPRQWSTSVRHKISPCFTLQTKNFVFCQLRLYRINHPEDFAVIHETSFPLFRFCAKHQHTTVSYTHGAMRTEHHEYYTVICFEK